MHTLSNIRDPKRWATLFKPSGLFLALLLFSSLVAPISSGSQTAAPSPAPPTLNSQSPGQEASDIANVFVCVRDKKGEPLTDLTSADFTLVENKSQQEILGTSFVGSGPLLVGVLLDFSGSTRADEYRKDDLRLLLDFFVKTIQSSDGAYLAAFTEELILVTDLTNDSRIFDLGLQRLAADQPFGSTALYDAIFSAAGVDFRGRLGRKVILVVSDFEDNSSRHMFEETIERALQTQTTVFPLVRRDTSGHASARTEKHAWEAARRMAEETGGVAYTFASPKELEKALLLVRLQLRSSYLLKYRHAGNSAKRKPVPLKVAVQRKDAEVIAPRARIESAK